MPGPCQSLPIPADDQALSVRTVRRPIEDSLVCLSEHRHPRGLAMCDVQCAGRDNSVLDVLKTIGADGFVVDGETPARDLPYLNPGFAMPALGTVHLSPE